MSTRVVRIPPGAFALAVALLTFVPLGELALLVLLGNALGFWPTVLLCASTGFAGAWLARWQGLQVLGKAQAAMAEGRFPGREVLDGMMLLAGGVVLLTPGLVTDAVGFALLIPATRTVIRKGLRTWWERHQGIVEGEVIGS